jgi:hypothetical protein
MGTELGSRETKRHALSQTKPYHFLDRFSGVKRWPQLNPLLEEKGKLGRNLERLGFTGSPQQEQ